MKNYALKHLFLVTFLVTTLGAWAQEPVNTGNKPYAGSTHTYAVTSHDGNSYQWFVTSDETGNTLVALGDDFTFDPAASYNTKTTTQNKIKISWHKEGTYYLYVQEYSEKDCYEAAINQKKLTIEVVKNEGGLDDGNDPTTDFLVTAPDHYTECATSIEADQNTSFPIAFKNLPTGASWSMKYTVKKIVGGVEVSSDSFDEPTISDPTFAIALDYSGSDDDSYLKETVFEITITEAKENKYGTVASNVDGNPLTVTYHIYPLPETSEIMMDDAAEAL